MMFSEWLMSLGLFSLTFLVIKRLFFQTNENGKKHAPSVGCLPIIGSLPYLPSPRRLHKWSLDKSYQLGGVFTFKVGGVYTVLLTSHEAIREAFIQRSVDFADRVNHFYVSVAIPERKGIIHHTYDEHFKKYHQLSLSVLKQFGFGLNIIENRICAEVETLIKNIRNLHGQSFNPKEQIMIAVENIISRISFGEPFDPLNKSDIRLTKLMEGLGGHFMNLLIFDFLPSLRHLPFFSKYVTNTTAETNELYKLFDQKIEKSRRPDAAENFVGCFVEKEGKNLDKTQLRVTIRDFVAAGTETLTGTIMWAIVLLANHPSVLERLQKELDSVVPRDRLPSLSDVSKMTYVEATILELMRFKTVFPMGVPRLTMCDTEVGGFFVPKGAQVFSMLYAVHMDVNVWGDPTMFRPERFINADGNIINKDLVIPFSIGKRSCTGELLARQELFLFLTGLVQQFDIRPPEGVEKIECEEKMDTVLWPTAYEARFLERL